MKRSFAVDHRKKFEMVMAEALILRTNDEGDALVRDGGADRWATSAVPGMTVGKGDRVLVTRTGDDRLLILGIVDSARNDSDVVLRAPKGRFVIESGEVDLRASQSVRIGAPEVDVTADRASLHTREASIIADVIRTTADELATSVGKWELTARRIVERAVDAVRAYEGVVHLTAKHSRTVVREAFDLVAKRATIASEEDTTIDGKRVLLG